MVSLSRVATKSNGPRPMNPFRDWGGVAQLMRVAFQSDVNAGNLLLLPDWPGLRWLNPIMGMLEWLGLDAPEQTLGYVWDESGRIVGNATLGLTNSQAGIWLLSNVAVHPGYRRRGIARALVEMAIQAARKYGGQYLMLQVHGDNLGARQLYERTGFRSLEQVREFIGSPIKFFHRTASDYVVASPTRAQWAAAQAMVAAHLPDKLKTYRHSLAGTFQVAYQRHWMAKLIELSKGSYHVNWCVLRSESVCGAMILQAQFSWGTHRVSLFIAPDARGQVEELMIAQVAQQLDRYASRRAVFAIPASHVQLAERLRSHNLRETRSTELMALEL